MPWLSWAFASAGIQGLGDQQPMFLASRTCRTARRARPAGRACRVGRGSGGAGQALKEPGIDLLPPDAPSRRPAWSRRSTLATAAGSPGAPPARCRCRGTAIVLLRRAHAGRLRGATACSHGARESTQTISSPCREHAPRAECGRAQPESAPDRGQRGLAQVSTASRLVRPASQAYLARPCPLRTPLRVPAEAFRWQATRVRVRRRARAARRPEVSPFATRFSSSRETARRRSLLLRLPVPRVSESRRYCRLGLHGIARSQLSR